MDKWCAPLHRNGENGDQDINWGQNATLAACGHNGVDVHLFEVMDAGEYVYCGRIELVGKPYTEIQPGEDGKPRKVWIFHQSFQNKNKSNRLLFLIIWLVKRCTILCYICCCCRKNEEKGTYFFRC